MTHSATVVPPPSQRCAQCKFSVISSAIMYGHLRCDHPLKQCYGVAPGGRIEKVDLVRKDNRWCELWRDRYA